MSYKIETIIEDGKEYKVKIYDNGDVYWTLNGKEHREKGPTFIGYNGHIEYKNGTTHRLDGPAAIWSDGYKVWCINDTEITEQMHTKVRTMLTLGLNRI
jgi:hypothetical protein